MTSRPDRLRLRSTELALPAIAEQQLEQPRPDAATLAAVRRTLGRRLPIGAPRNAEPMDRLDMLQADLTPDTAALVVLWLGGTRRASANTRQAYADDILAWADWARTELGRELFALDLHRAEVTMWVTKQTDAGAAPSSIARRLSSLNSLYRYAQGWGLQVVSPISADDHRPKYQRGRKPSSARVLDARQVSDMLAAATNARDVIVVGVLFTDAIRVSELCGADRDDLEPGTGGRCWLTVTRKGGEREQVSLDLVVCQALAAYDEQRSFWNGEGPEPLLVDDAGKRLDRHDVARIVKRLARAAGIPDPRRVTPHSMRASAITDQTSRRSIHHVQDLSGHADLRTLMIYVEEAGKRERLEQITGDLGRVMAAVPHHLLDRS